MPAHVREAPSHPDPYPYYTELATHRAAVRDEANGWWVAASAAAVQEVLTSDACHTRPPDERVPRALGPGPAADLFGQLVRLSDGPRHDAMKAAIAAAFAQLDLAEVRSIAQARAEEFGALDDGATVTRFAFALPVAVVAHLLGISWSRGDDVAAWLGDYGAATVAAAIGAPRPEAELLARGHAGAGALLALVGELYRDPAARGPLLSALADEGTRHGIDDEDVIANAVGLLVQSFVATASLITLTLLALARHPNAFADVERDRGRLADVIQEVLRCDPTTSSTIRWLAQDAVVAGREMKRGDLVIVAIAAANRDGSLNPDPERFDPDRPDRRYLEFGTGAHACPARGVAPLLAEVAVGHVLDSGTPLDALTAHVTYAASPHIRTAILG
jgi:cytochrome P450